MQDAPKPPGAVGLGAPVAGLGWQTRLGIRFIMSCLGPMDMTVPSCR
jgi:hypothetical protein